MPIYMKGRPKNSPEEFGRKLDKCGGPEACWIWTGLKNKRGYGATSFDSVWISAHRLAFYFEHGEIPKGMCVCHKCDNPACCNPKHLFLGTRVENVSDMVSKERQARGMKHHSAKITEQQVLEMRRLYLETKVPVRIIAERFRVKRQTASRAILGKTWRHLKGAICVVKHRGAKLNENEVIEIRKLRETTELTIKQIAERFHISKSGCNDIIYRTRWKDI